MKAAPPSAKAQRAMLERLRAGLVLAGHDNRCLRFLERRREARGLPLHDPRTGALLASRAWQITDAGVAAALRLAKPAPRQTSRDIHSQTDIEDAIAACPASSGGRPDAAPLTDPDTPAPDRAGASAPEGRPVETCARGRTPETAHA